MLSFVSDVVAMIVPLYVLYERLEVKLWKFILDLEHDVLLEFDVELGRSR